MTPGRRVQTLDEVEQPGDYWLDPVGPSLWFRLPRSEPCPEQYRALPYFEHSWDTFWTGRHHRISGDAGGWTITEDPDGSVTVAPSILTWVELGEAHIRTEWHGFLEHGAWRE